VKARQAGCLVLLFFITPVALAATRHYYIAAEDVSWDYAPSGMDLIHGRPIPQPFADLHKFNKTRYVEYTDASFKVRKPQPEWLGILGPVIRAEVGDGIEVEFLNRSHSPHSIHPHGLRYDKANEGALYLPAGAGARVAPGGRFTYHWIADEGSGPGPGDPSSVVWWYHPHTDAPVEMNAGLLGPIIITAKGKANPDGSPKGVDREFVAAFMIFDELQGKDAGLFHAINGYVFGNLPGLVMKQGDRVRWYLLGMGNEKDLHTPHWHGKTVEYNHRHADVIELLPGSMATADMVADNPGTWLFHCHVADHMEAGMMAVFTIYAPQKCSSPVQFESADFWKAEGKFTVRLKNAGAKPVRSVVVKYDHMMTEQFRRRPFKDEWTLDKPMQPGQEQTLEVPGFLPGYANQVYGWILFPKTVTYKDGTAWQPKDEGECFSIFWRDAEHPEMKALPPLFREMSED